MELELGDLTLSEDNVSQDGDSIKFHFETIDDKKNLSLTGLFLCSPKHWSYRYMILTLICLITIALNFSYDMTDGLAKPLIDVMNINTLTYEFLDGFGNIPNIVLCVLGGYLIDRCLGIRKGLLLTTTLSLFGEILFCLGIFLHQYWMMILGTVVTFIAVELLEMILYIYQARWFKNKELTFALGLSMSAECLGSALAMSFSNLFYELLSFIPNSNIHMGMAYMLGLAAALFSVICGLIIIYLDSRASKQGKSKMPTTGIDKSCFKFYKFLSLSVILMSIAFAFYDPVIESFSTIGQLFFIKKFKLNINAASFGNGLLSWINIFLLPLVGLAIDVVGYHVWWAVIGVTLALTTHFLLLTSSLSYIPFVAQFIYAVSDSLFSSSMSPLPAYVVPESQEGTIYGLMDCAENIMFVVCVFVTGYIADTAGYNALEMFYIVLLFISFIALLNLLILDSVSAVSVINISGTARRDREKEEESSSDSSSDSDSDSSSSSSSS